MIQDATFDETLNQYIVTGFNGSNTYSNDGVNWTSLTKMNIISKIIYNLKIQFGSKIKDIINRNSVMNILDELGEFKGIIFECVAALLSQNVDVLDIITCDKNLINYLPEESITQELTLFAKLQ